MRRGASVTRVVLETAGEDEEHRIEVGFEPGETKRVRVDGSAVDSLSASEARPLVSVFLPERLELVKGAPAGAPGAPRPGGGGALARARRDARGLLARAGAAQRPDRPHPRGRGGPGRARRLGRGARPPGHPPDGGPRGGRGRAARAVRGPRRAARPAGLGRAPLPPALAGRRRRGAGGRAGGAARGGPRARLHRPRAPPGRAAAAPRRLCRCAPTARRASSARPCSRCCSPSAACWPSAAGGLR